MEIDVIIPLYKPGKELFTLLDKLGSQSVPVHQVILLNTEEKYFEQLIYGIRFLETYQNIKVYHVSKREFDHGGTRRMGVKKSSADVFVMMTQDAMPKDDRLIEKLVEPLSWCGPCKMMTNDIFPQEKVGKYMNENFVCVKYDMEKGEGVELKKRYEVSAYPTFLVIDADGTMVHRFVGYRTANDLLSELDYDPSSAWVRIFTEEP